MAPNVPAKEVIEERLGQEKYKDYFDFTWKLDEEPHRQRRTEILKKYPEIKKLFGYEWKTKYLVLATVALQLTCAVLLRNASWPLWLFVAYVVGGTANHSLFLAIHEISHNLGFKKMVHNRYFSMVANLPIGIPYAIAFKPYHMEHHRNQGVDGIDSDIPLPVEAAVIGNSFPMKLAFMFFQIMFYAFRPMLVKPMSTDKLLALNWVVQFSFDAVFVYCFGWKPMFYLLVSTFLAGSIHPTAGHFLAEHYEVVAGVETYSYYGPLNYVAYNVGYHNEHHDFPSIPWSRLPLVRKIAPEYYDTLPQCPSWPGLIVKYLFDPNLGAYSRIKRPGKVKSS